MIKTIIDKLFDVNINHVEYPFKTDIMSSNIEAYAYMNQQSIILFDYIKKGYKTFNYNLQLNHLLGCQPLLLELNCLYEKASKTDLIKIERYLEVINMHFHCKKTYKEKNFLFTILFSYTTDKGEEGCAIDFIPLFYNNKLELCYTLCKLETVAHAGKPILRKHHVNSNKTYEYLSASKQFVEKNKVNLTLLECEILRLSGEGKKEVEIANIMNITLPNLKCHKSQIFEKIQVKSISEAIFIAYKRGYL